MKKMKFNWTWLGILLAVCLMVVVPAVDVLADTENSSAEESSAEEFCMHQIPSDDCASCSLQASAETLTLSVEYPSVIKCGEPTTFTLNVTGGSGNYKYRLAHIMIKDGSELLQVYDVSYPTKPNLGDYSENNQIEFTFYASGTYYIGFSAMDMDTYNTVSTRLYDYTLDIQDESYPSVESIVETVAAECETKCTTDFEKALWMHDWMLDNADYDYSYKYCSAEGILARGMGTCEAYHRTYVKLLNKVGIQTGRITGNGHVWTAVKMDGEWYQVDSTWDDGGEANKGTFYEHMYFGLNDSIMGLVHSDHSSAVPGYESTSLENNYFIKTGQITQWSDPFVDEIKKNIADGKTEFELSVTNSMPAAYKNVIYNLVAYQLSQQTWDNTKIAVSYANDTLSCKLSVPAVSVTLSQNYANIKLGSSFTLTATVQPANSSDSVTWKSSNTQIATVSPSGQVNALGLGQATITATAGNAATACTVDIIPDISLTTLGASVRISDPYGIRYGIQLKKDSAYKSTDIVEYGTLIIASGTLGGSELTLGTKSVRKIKAENVYSEDSSQLTYTGVLINIPNSFFETNVKGRGYLIYKDVEGIERVLYSETVEKSFYGVAQSAYTAYLNITNPTDEQKNVIKKLEGILKNK